MSQTKGVQMLTIELTRDEIAVITEAAEAAYYTIILDRGREADDAELEMFIALAVEGEQNRKFVAANR
jgi:hypothetical protein